MLGSFGCLVCLFVAGRFEFAYVWQHSDSSTPIQYRIAGVWAGQQGSFLLWACATALFGLASASGARSYRRWYTVVFAAFLGALCCILTFESPFALNLVDGRVVVPFDGFGLAGELMDFWVTVHPPVIFLGFGALTVLFSYAFAALLTGDLKAWVAQVRPWAILAATLVGLGLCMGGFWAYETLGWGGFWMWDPVENVSFVPWMLAIAFMHGIPVQVVKGKWIASNLLLAGLPFLTFVYGTYLTRSGVLGEASVHSFSEMQRTALWILLATMGVASVGFLTLWTGRALALRAEKQAAEAAGAGLHREGVLRAGSSLLLIVGFTTLVGMSAPAASSWVGKQPARVDEGLYHQVLVWFFVPLMLVLAAAPFVGWPASPGRMLASKIYNVFCVAFGLVGLAMFLAMRTHWGDDLDLGATMGFLGGRHFNGLPWMLILIGLCLFVFVGALWRIVESVRQNPPGVPALVSHAAVATLMAGLIMSRGFDRKTHTMVQEGATGLEYVGQGWDQPDTSARGLQFDYIGQTAGTEDRNNKVLFRVTRGGSSFTISPGLYYARSGEAELQAVVWPYIRRLAVEDLYFALQPPEEDAGDAVTLAPGQSTEFRGYRMTLERVIEADEAGSSPVRFSVRFKVKTHIRAFEITPELQMTPRGERSVPAPLGRDYKLAVESIDPGAGTARVKVKLARPIYKIDVFYKPLTVLVWAGAGLLALAGFAAAWTRRVRTDGVPEPPR